MELGRKIYYTREEKKLTKKQFAKEVGVTINTLNKWENCEVTPKMNQVNKIAEVLDVSVTELLDNDIRNLLDKDIEIKEKNNNKITVELLKIVGIIILTLVLFLVMFYL